MLFNSYEFIFAFLPLCLAVFFLLGKLGWTRSASLWLSAMSLGFYSWWNPDPSHPWSPQYLGLILLSIVFNYGLGARISGAVEHENRIAAKRILTVGVVINLAALAYFKYAGFFVATVNSLTGTHWPVVQIALPLAISFFTFTQIAYLVDAYHGVTKEYNFRWYLLFVTFFPHLIAGPIVLYKSLMPQFAKEGTWRFNADNFASGLTLFALGLFKKAVIADSLSPIANAVFREVGSGTAPDFFAAWSGALAYTLQLYFDFSGYSDMAIGIALMFNVRFPLNFDSPYKARDIIDFWRRWHITLSQFLRDHLYIPLGGNRKGPIRRHLNLFLTMLLGGLWHGAGWTFILWGALHGAFLVINHTWNSLTQGMAWAHSRLVGVAGRVLTLLAVIVGWVFFRAPTVQDAWQMLAGMCGAHGLRIPAELKPILDQFAPSLDLPIVNIEIEAESFALILLVLAVALFAPNTNEIMRSALPAKENQNTPPPLWKPSAKWAVAAAIALSVSIFKLSGVTEFLYFQF